MELDGNDLLCFMYQVRVQFLNVVNVCVKKSRRQDATLWSTHVVLTQSCGNDEQILTL